MWPKAKEILECLHNKKRRRTEEKITCEIFAGIFQMFKKNAIFHAFGIYIYVTISEFEM